MKVYLEPLTNSRGIQRVRENLIRYAPISVRVVDSPSEADLEIIHVFGRHNSIERRIQELNGKPYAMIQYVLRSSQKPDTEDWIAMWTKSKLVWSYYNLMALVDEDKPWQAYSKDFNFYYAPLGVDSNVFKQVERDDNYEDRKYIIGASAQHALSESARECAIAANFVKKKMFFLGHELRRGSNIECYTNITDEGVAKYFSQCTFISGLRRCEGFELPVIEGALCGAVPIVFDRPEMRHWFNEFAIFMPEGDRNQVIYTLRSIFSADGVIPINEQQKQLIRERFNWETIIKGFWERVL